MFEWIKSLTGDWGPALIELYKANALWINGLVLIYGIILLLAWRNLYALQENLIRLLNAADSTFLLEMLKDPARFSLESIPAELWQEAFTANQFPLLSRQNSFQIYRSSVNAFKKATHPKKFLARVKKLFPKSN